MSDDTSKSKGATSAWPLPAAVVAMLTFLGFANLPGTQQSGPAAVRKDAPGATSSVDDAPIDALLDSHHFGDGLDTEAGPREKIATLDPLLRFYASRLARLAPGQRALLAQGAEKPNSLDPAKVVRWMTDPQKTGDDLDILVCMVPDPILSGSAYSFDSTITALLLAMRNVGYVLDSYRIDWKGPSGRRVELATSTPASGTLRMSLPTPGSVARARHPGVLLLRKLKLGDGEAGGETIRHDLVMLLLVPETPIVGVDTGIFQTSLEIASECDKRRPPGPVRIIGPSFSGSVSSILRALKSWLGSQGPGANDPAAPGSPLRVHWINGTALSLNVDAIRDAFSVGAVKGDQIVRLENVIYGYDDMLTFALEFLREHASPLVANNRIAFLTEETTGYGESLKSMKVPGVASDAGAAGFHEYRFTFPAQIAEMRRRYARQDQGAASSSHMFRTAERLHFEEEESEKSEFIRPESPAFTAASDELRLLRVAGQINSLDIRFVYLSATDIRDRLFVAEFIRANCPDAMVINPQAEPAFTHKETIGQLRGLLFASTYPMWLIRADQHHQFLTLPEHAAYGMYNATIAQLCELAAASPDKDVLALRLRQLADYNWEQADSKKRGPALWMTVSSQKGHLPLAVAVPPAPSSPANPGQYAASIWRPSSEGVLLVDDGDSETSRALFFSRVPVTSGVSWLLPMVFGVVAAATLAYCHAKNLRIREENLVDARYPLPREAVGDHLPFNNLLNQGAARARDLGLFADAGLGHVYRHWGLALLGIAMFCFMYFYASFGGRHLQNRNWLVPLAVAVVIWAILRWRLLRYSDAGVSSARLTRRLFIAPLIGCTVVAAVFSQIAPTSPSTQLIVFAACALVCLSALAVLAWRGRSRPPGGATPQGDDERIVPTSAVLGVVVWSMLLGFLTFSASTLEQHPLSSMALRLVLAALFGAVIHIAIYLREYWTRLDAWTESLLSLPMGDAFDRLPLRLTSRLGNFAEVWTGGGDEEMDERFHLIRANLSRNLKSGTASDVRVRSKDLEMVRTKLDGTSGKAEDPNGTQAITALLSQVWLDRSPIQGFSDPGAKPPGKAEPNADEAEAAPPSSPSDEDDSAFDSLPASAVEAAETYLALEVVRYLNHNLEILWVRVTALTVLTLLLVATVNCYPFQPAGTLFQWTMFIVVLTVMVLLRVLVGFHRNALISRVNKVPTDRSLWNLDFVGKLVAYVGPVVAVFAALSVSMSDLIRLVLGPLVR